MDFFSHTDDVDLGSSGFILIWRFSLVPCAFVDKKPTHIVKNENPNDKGPTTQAKFSDTKKA